MSEPLCAIGAISYIVYRIADVISWYAIYVISAMCYYHELNMRFWWRILMSMSWTIVWAIEKSYCAISFTVLHLSAYDLKGMVWPICSSICNSIGNIGYMRK